jgi:hypothetical protein
MSSEAGAWPELDFLPADFGQWRIALGKQDGLVTVVGRYEVPQLVGHPRLSIRLGLSMNHRVVDGEAQAIDPLHDEIEDFIIAGLAGPPRFGVLAVRTRNNQFIQWCAYMRGEGEAQAMLATLLHAYPDLGIASLIQADPQWLLYRSLEATSDSPPAED